MAEFCISNGKMCMKDGKFCVPGFIHGALSFADTAANGIVRINNDLTVHSSFLPGVYNSEVVCDQAGANVYRAGESESTFHVGKYDSSNTRVWGFDTGSGTGASNRAVGIALDSTGSYVYAAGQNGTLNKDVWKLDASTGAEQWGVNRFSHGLWVTVGSDGFVYVVGSVAPSTTDLVKLDPSDGSEVWRRQVYTFQTGIGSRGHIQDDAANGRLVMIVPGASSDSLAMWDYAGNEVDTSPFFESLFVVRSVTSDADGNIYTHSVGVGNRKLKKFNASGTLLLTNDTDTDRDHHSMRFIGDRLVAVGDRRTSDLDNTFIYDTSLVLQSSGQIGGNEIVNHMGVC